MQTHTARVEVEDDGRLVLEDLPFNRGELVDVCVAATSLVPRKLTPEEIERSREIRRALKGRMTFATDFDPEEPACPPEHWEALSDAGFEP